MRWDDRQAQERVGRLDALIGDLEALPEPARSTAMETIAALVDVYGEGLRRIVGAVGPAAAEEASRDQLVGHLLLVHDLHPLDLETRVRHALDEVRPYLASHGGDVELVGIDGADVTLRMNGSCHGCPSSAVTLELAIEDAIRGAAPEVERIDAGGAEPPPGRFPALPMAHAGGAPAGRTWAPAGPLEELSPGTTLLREVSGEELLFARLDDTLYAYRPACPACGASLERAALLVSDLLCPGCGQRYDVRGAGRCRDTPALSLEPVPLLVGRTGRVRVALGAVGVS